MFHPLTQVFAVWERSCRCINKCFLFIFFTDVLLVQIIPAALNYFEQNVGSVWKTVKHMCG